jgi:hypothetical protein
MTAAVVAMPFALLPIAWARVAFFATGAGLFAWTLGALPHRRLAFFSGSFVDAFALAQWDPFITGSIELPAFLAGAILSAKPTVGLALGIAYLLPFTRRTVAALAGAATTFALSVALRPSWPLEFLAAARHAPHIMAPVTLLPLGPLVLLALIKWRRSEARLLACLALVPQTIVPYATVPLFLVPRSRKETMILVLLADALYGIWVIWRSMSPLPHMDPVSLAARVTVSGNLILALLYLPCVVMVLRRPNTSASIIAASKILSDAAA